jgi:hypothetical protein
MSQVLTPEEITALFEGLRETEDGPGSRHRDLPEEIVSEGRIFPDSPRITGCHKVSNWLMALAELRWPHL